MQLISYYSFILNLGQYEDLSTFVCECFFFLFISKKIPKYILIEKKVKGLQALIHALLR